MRRAVLGLTLVVAACGGKSDTDGVAPVTLPLPVTMIVGQEVVVLPITLVVAENALGWADSLPTRAAALGMADSMIAEFLTTRAPEVNWVLPARLRELYRRNPIVLADPDRMPSAVLRGQRVDAVPDPMRAQLRTLVAFTGGRFVMAPAALFFTATPDGQGRAQLSVAIADTRTGRIMFRTVATGDASGPRVALRRALRSLVPETP